MNNINHEKPCNIEPVQLNKHELLSEAITRLSSVTDRARFTLERINGTEELKGEVKENTKDRTCLSKVLQESPELIHREADAIVSLLNEIEKAIF